MNDDQLYDLLQTIILPLSQERYLWRVGGSAALRVHGIDIDRVSVGDLDLTSEDEGIEFCLKHFEGARENSRAFPRHIRFELQGQEVKVLGTRPDIDYLERSVFVPWRGLYVPVLPLQDILTIYEKKVDKPDKAAFVRQELEWRHGSAIWLKDS
ncbi:MAG: hypothetical protein AABX70_06445 [Nanoarchaeota archaeon]